MQTNSISAENQSKKKKCRSGEERIHLSINICLNIIQTDDGLKSLL